MFNLPKVRSESFIDNQILVSIVAELFIWQEIGRAGYFSSMSGFRDILCWYIKTLLNKLTK